MSSSLQPKVYNLLDFNDFSEMLITKFNNKEPLFLSRFGGSDFEIIMSERYKTANKYELLLYIETVSNMNGYFDLEVDTDKKIINFKKYCETLENIYFNQKIFTYCCDSTIVRIEKAINTSDVNKFLSHLMLQKIAISNYGFIEKIYPFLNLFKNIAENKKILIISPFSALVEEQYKNKNNLIKNYIYPDFELITYSVPITYNDTINTTHINTKNNWLEQSAFMCEEITKIEFDIALISAGSYAMYLGDYIYMKMQKQSIYIGGVLNVLFNIYGKRYDTPFFNNIMNIPYQIKNNVDINTISGGKTHKSEALLAYF